MLLYQRPHRGILYRIYGHSNPPKQGEKTITDYLKEFGITEYPQVMRMTTHIKFSDAHLIGGVDK
jgi:hypothetical protein